MFIYFFLAAVAMFAPKVYDYVASKLAAAFEHHPDLNRNFENSIFPAASFNFGPKCVCCGHTDHGNTAYFWCPITSLGDNDTTKGGHLIFDLKLVIEFPPGSTILIPSGILRHGNTPIQDHETRMSFTQYAAGGLIRWVEYGFHTEEKFKAEDEKGWNKMVLNRATRAAWALDLFSKYDELEQDHQTLPPVTV
jgi:hypothetical protein